MAIINAAEILAAKYPQALGKNPVEKAEAVLDYLGLGIKQPAKGVAGDVRIEGEEVIKALTELADSEAFQAFNISLAIARAEDIDGSASVGLIVNKI